MVLWRQACALHNVMAWNSSLMWIMHPIIGQPINRSLCAYMRCFGLLGRESLQPVMQSEVNNGRNLKPYAMEFNAAAACMFACHGTQPVPGEDREISLLLPSFSLLLFRFSTLHTPVNFALLFVHPFRCLDGCSPFFLASSYL